MRTYVICKREKAPTPDSKRGSCGTTFVQWWPSCGNFEIPYSAVAILDQSWARDDARGRKWSTIVAESSGNVTQLGRRC